MFFDAPCKVVDDLGPESRNAIGELKRSSCGTRKQLRTVEFHLASGGSPSKE
jgi:hypothetical protein